MEIRIIVSVETTVIFLIIDRRNVLFLETTRGIPRLRHLLKFSLSALCTWEMLFCPCFRRRLSFWSSYALLSAIKLWTFSAPRHSARHQHVSRDRERDRHLHEFRRGGVLCCKTYSSVNIQSFFIPISPTNKARSSLLGSVGDETREKILAGTYGVTKL